GMFKGLKSKLEDGAKKAAANVQAAASQYGEQLSQQFRDISANASDAGSDAGSTVGRRFFGANDSGSMNYSVGNALMEEVTDADLLDLDLPGTRQRRDSGGSTHSNESSLSALFASVPGLVGSGGLDTIDSDMESVTDGDIGFVQRTPREQGYKNRYVDLVKKYNQVVTENNKCRTILQQSQDKAINRIRKLKEEKRILSERMNEMHANGKSEESAALEARAAKYEELLEKAKAEIVKNRKELASITEECNVLKESMKDGNPEQALSELAANRVAAEWKERFEKVEEQWTERLNKAEQDAAITLATVKAEMHAALEGKDREIDVLRSKCRTLEVQDGQANERWQKKVDELKASCTALETEKETMIEKLSEAKAQGVKAVLIEEEAKRDALKAEMVEEKRKLSEECDERIREMEKEVERKIEELKAQLASSMSLRSSADDEKKKSEIEEKMEDAQREMRELREKLRDEEEKRTKQVAELEEAIEAQLQRGRTEMAEMIKEHEEILASSREQLEAQLRTANEKSDLNRVEAVQLRTMNEDLQRQLKGCEEREKREEAGRKGEMVELESELSTTRASLAEIEGRMEEMQKDLSESRIRESSSRQEADELADRLEELRGRAEENEERLAASSARFNEELSQLKEMIEERNGTVKRIEEEKENLEAELASAIELSAMHEHLRKQLEDAIESRKEAECRILEIERRAEKAEKELEEDRKRMEEETREREKRMEALPVQSSPSIPHSESLIDMGTDEETIQPSLVSVLASSPVTASSPTASTPIGDTVVSVSHSMEDEWKSAVEDGKDEEMQLLRAQLKQAEERVAALVADLTVERETRTKLEEEIKPLSLQLTELSVQLDAARDTSSGETNILRAQLSELQAENEDLTRRFLDAAADASSFESDAKDWADQVGKERDEARKLAERVSVAETYAREASDRAAKAEAALEAAEARAAMAAAEVKEVEETATEAETRATKAERRADEAEERLKEEREKKGGEDEKERAALRAQVKETESRVVAAESRASEADERALAAEDEKKKMEKRLEECEKEKEVVAKRAEDFESRCSDLLHTLEEARGEKSEVEKRVKILEEESQKKEGEREVSQGKEAELEKMISDLRAEAESLSTRVREEEEKTREAERKMVEKEKEYLRDANSMEEELNKLKKQIEGEMIERAKKDEEEKKIRDQYACALEKLRSEVEEGKRREEEQEKEKEEGMKRLEEMERVKNEIQEKIEGVEQAHSAALEKERKRGEELREKAVRSAEGEWTAAKAEMLMEADSLRASIRSLEKEMDEGRVQRAQMEQKIADAEMERDTADRKRAEREESALRVEKTLKDEVEELKGKISGLESERGEEIKKAAAKQDNERQKIVKELQKEVKQLYSELNEKQQLLEEARQRIRGLEEWQNGEEEEEKAEEKRVSSTQAAAAAAAPAPGDAVGAEELASMRSRLEEARKEADEKGEMIDKMKKQLESKEKVKPQRSSASDYDGLSFAEPTEAEYLRNVLYRYMAERETLGKEIVTLARVIGTVAKFNHQQLEAVISAEESRTAGWLPVTGVSHGRH
ncbi:golg-4, partial [Pristionchus pacificus]